MRSRILAMALTAISGLSLAACGNGGEHNNDAATLALDMSMAPLNCLGYGACVLDCLNKAGATGDPSSCITLCQAETRPASLNYWSEAYRCGDDYCNGVADASVAKCMSSADGTQEIDTAGEPSGTCLDCLLNARDIVLADFTDPNNPKPPTGMCPQPSSPDCKGGAECVAKFQRCINDL